MVRCLDLVEDYLRYMGHSYERLDGSKKATERTAAVARFNNPALHRFIMLLSTRAGGLGLNLTAADTVIIYDSDWNPHNDLQAQARAHRIGQTKAVKVYRLLTRKSYEMEMFHAASMKLGLDRAVLAHQRAEGDATAAAAAAGAAGDKSGGALLKPTKQNLEFSHTEVEQLLKRGAYDVFRGDDTEGQEFQEADIDQILQRQSHKVVYGKSESLTKNLASSFSKASFVSLNNKEDIDLDDPDFWKKVCVCVLCVCVCVCVYVYFYFHLFFRFLLHLLTCIHILIYSHTPTYIYIYTHTHRPSVSRSRRRNPRRRSRAG
jgi:superfamily II DNA/RNA helicase